MKITVISGTNRPGSNSRRVAGLVEREYAGRGASTTLLDLTELPPSLFLPASYSQKPPEFSPFADAVVRSDGLVFVVAEYNGGFPGILKYFIDMLPFPESFEEKAAAFIGISAGRWGALRAVEQLQGVWGYRNGYSYSRRVFIPNIRKELGETGFTSLGTGKRIEAQSAGFMDFCRRLSEEAV